MRFADEGEYTLTYTATDGCGNVGTATRRVIVESAQMTIQNENAIDLETENGDVLLYE